MANFKSLDGNIKVTPEELAEICEYYAFNKPTMAEMCERYSTTLAIMNNYLFTYYYGIVPKENQIRITIKSKV